MKQNKMPIKTGEEAAGANKGGAGAGVRPKTNESAKKRFIRKQIIFSSQAGIASGAKEITEVENKVFEAFKNNDVPAVIAGIHGYYSTEKSEEYMGVILGVKDMKNLGKMPPGRGGGKR